MKKLVGILAAGLLVLGVAGQAKAAFTTDGELIRVMYDATTGIEVATDLGQVATLATKTNDTSFDTISLSTFGTAAAWSQVNTAYFGISQAGSLAYMAGTGTMTMGAKLGSGFLSAETGLVSNYTTGGAITGDPNSVTFSTASLQSYYSVFDKGGAAGAAGSYGGALLAGGSTTEVNLGTGGTQYLYQFLYPSTKNNIAGAIVTAAIPAGFTIVTGANGTTETEINPQTPSTTPIPPSILLMGSGLLGLIGVGRRKLFA